MHQGSSYTSSNCKRDHKLRRIGIRVKVIVRYTLFFNVQTPCTVWWRRSSMCTCSTRRASVGTCSTRLACDATSNDSNDKNTMTMPVCPPLTTVSYSKIPTRFIASSKWQYNLPGTKRLQYAREQILADAQGSSGSMTLASRSSRRCRWLHGRTGRWHGYLDELQDVFF